MIDQKLRILFFSVETGAGGTERVISTLCNSRLGKEYAIFILTIIKGDWFYSIPDDVKRIGIVSRDDYLLKGKLITLPKVFNGYCSTMKEINPDIVISFLPEPCFVATHYRKKFNALVIGSERGNPYYQFGNLIYRILGNYFYGKADGFVFQTAGAKEFFCEKIQKKSIIIGNPVSYEEIEHNQSKLRRKEIVAVGRNTDEKNYPLLIKAFSRVREKHPDYVLRIYGKYNKSDIIIKLIKQLGLSDVIKLEGMVKNVKQRIADSSIFVLTSKSEGMPNALIEAMSIGLPVIATDCPSGGPRELINNGENGLLVQNEDEEGVVNAINFLIENPQYAEMLGERAKDILKDYSEELICDKWNKYILSVRSNNI